MGKMFLFYCSGRFRKSLLVSGARKLHALTVWDNTLYVSDTLTHCLYSLELGSVAMVSEIFICDDRMMGPTDIVADVNGIYSINNFATRMRPPKIHR